MDIHRIYTNSRAKLLSWAKSYSNEGLKVRAVERWGQNGYPGHSKFVLEIYNPGLSHDEFEGLVHRIWDKIR